VIISTEIRPGEVLTSLTSPVVTIWTEAAAQKG